MTAVAMRTQKLSYKSSADERGWYESDLQLAAELGKTLLERNHELETNLRQQQIYIEEQEQEIEFLTRQLSALRDVNESRLKLYEQLETSITEFDKTNNKLQQETVIDKKKIKSLSNTVGFLERRCEELQLALEEIKTANEEKVTNRFIRIIDNEDLTDVGNKDGDLYQRDFLKNQENAYEDEISKLKTSLSKAKCQLAREQRQKEELDLNLNLVLQENTSLREQLECYREKVLYWSGGYDQQNDDIECIQKRRSFCLHSDVEDESLTREELSLFHLKNGIVAYGKPESLLPVDDQMEDFDNRNNNSLLSELDTQYRLLIDKYECMVESRSNQPNKSDDNEMTCLKDHLSDSEFSSGFSEDSDQNSLSNQHILNISSNEPSPIDNHFNHGPPAYKKLFAEIFSVLKRSIPNECPESDETINSASESKPVSVEISPEQPVRNLNENVSDKAEKANEKPKISTKCVEKSKTSTPKSVNSAAPVLARIQKNVNTKRSFVSNKTASNEMRIVQNIRNSAFLDLRARFENSNCSRSIRTPGNKTYADVLKGRQNRPTA